MRVISSATLSGIEGISVCVESTKTVGLPAFTIVGLGDSAVQEAKERVKSALLVGGFSFPPLRITLNLSPSDIPKRGTALDLAMALAVALDDDIQSDESICVLGELGLDGTVKFTPIIFPLILSLAQKKIFKKFLVPSSYAQQIAIIPSIEIYGVSTLEEAMDFFKQPSHSSQYLVSSQSTYDFPFVDISGERYYFMYQPEYDFCDVKGQDLAKRGCLIAAAGFHNILLEGSPGAGKSMMLKRLRYILPPLSQDEILAIANAISLQGDIPDFMPLRPFRSPHHSATKGAIFGGGSKESRIGEVGLSHQGMLFFDECNLFDKGVLEALREPLEDYHVLVSRVNSKVQYHAKFLFAAAQNPCPCGNFLSRTKECRCTPLEINRFKNRLSEPLLDRIDIFIQVDEPQTEAKEGITSHMMFESVQRAFIQQKKRGQLNFNGKLSDNELKQVCLLTDEAKERLQQAVERFSLSYRAYNKVLKVARTIADLEAQEMIDVPHIFEALSYRKR